jgi:hypothetical protein
MLNGIDTFIIDAVRKAIYLLPMGGFSFEGIQIGYYTYMIGGIYMLMELASFIENGGKGGKKK